MLQPDGKTEAHPDPADERFRRILKEYGRWLRGTIRRLCPRDLGIQPEDLEQEVALRLWRTLSRRQTIDNPAAFLHRAAATATIDAMRRVRAQRKDRTSSLDGEDEETETARPVADGRTPSPERLAMERQVLDQAGRSLARLPENRRRAVELYLQGFKIQEVADLLRWTEPKTRNLLYRGLQTLRRDLGEAGFELELPT